MANVGSLGGIRFNTSMRRVLTFDNYRRSGVAKYATHEIIGEKSRLEYTGLEPEEITIDIQLMSSLGSKPEEQLKKLRKMRDDGEVVSFIIGTKPVSQNKWIIKNLGEAVPHWGNRGKMLFATVQVTLTEYVMNTTEITGDIQATPWSDVQNRIESVQEKIEEVSTGVLDFLDEVEDVTGVSL